MIFLWVVHPGLMIRSSGSVGVDGLLHSVFGRDALK